LAHYIKNNKEGTFFQIYLNILGKFLILTSGLNFSDAGQGMGALNLLKQFLYGNLGKVNQDLMKRV